VRAVLSISFRDCQQKEGCFRKTAKLMAARHVRRRTLSCEQRGVDFKKRDFDLIPRFVFVPVSGHRLVKAGAEAHA
jgi:hypothetical protein